MPFNWTEIVSRNQLAAAMRAYEGRFGHPVPSAALKNAALGGTVGKLAQKVYLHLESDKPNEQWKGDAARLGEELINRPPKIRTKPGWERETQL